MYDKIGIAGKFRLVHQAHIELIIKASCITNVLCIFIVNSKNTKRYCSINQLKEYFIDLSSRINSFFIINIVPEESDLLRWDKQILKLQPDIQAMIDSKEVYGNKLIKNIYMNLHSDFNISVSNIEKDIYCRSNFALIEKNFRKFLSIKIFLYHNGQDTFKVKLILKKLKVYFEAKVFDKVNLHLHSDLNKLYNSDSKIIFTLLQKKIDFDTIQSNNYLKNTVFIDLLEYDNINDLVTYIEKVIKIKREKIRC